MTITFGKTAAAGVVLLALAGFAAEASAHGYHGRSRVGVYIGAPVIVGGAWYGYRPYYYGYPYPYYYPPAVVTAPPVYIEQPAVAQSVPPPASPAAPAESYWYYCGNPDGYYPYVKECPGGWRQVPPRPAQ